MRPRDRLLAERIENCLLVFDKKRRPLPGIQSSRHRTVLVEQFLESVHRVKYPSVIAARPISEERANPNSALFDPVRAAIIHQRHGRIDDSFWMVFLFVHFGKHSRAGWKWPREIYGGLGARIWDWPRISQSPSRFREWLAQSQDDLKREGQPHGFGSHRKYESIDAYSANGTGSVVESYVDWIAPPRNHLDLVNQGVGEVGQDPKAVFDWLFRSMQAVHRFGRTARFDYLAMVGKLGLANIQPGFAYLNGATGPLKGARLLFGDAHATPSVLDTWLVDLDAELGLGMQTMEDALCNWQKNPNTFLRFRG